MALQSLGAFLEQLQRPGTIMLQVPIPVIDMAVMMRDLSAYKKERERAARELGTPAAPLALDTRATQKLIDALENALFAALLLTYAQGMALLHKASTEQGYQLKLAEVARIWRSGCIIRASLLDEIWAAYRQQPELSHLLLNRELAQKVLVRQAELRQIVCFAAKQGVPAPGLMSALAYFDGFRSARLPANLVQAQRDYFGAHGYERLDTAGSFHSEWKRS
jgi:6-phosphogluconate dehydrogenase